LPRKLPVVIYSEVPVDPLISTKTNRVGYSEIQAGIPMDNNKNVENDFTYTEEVGIVGESLGFVKKFRHSLDSRKKTLNIMLLKLGGFITFQMQQ